MTPPAAPAPSLIRIDVVCVCCGSRAKIWIAREEITPMKFAWLPLENAFAHKCAKCLYQRAPADAPLTIRPNDDPERAAHHRRTSGGYHTTGWRTQ